MYRLKTNRVDLLVTPNHKLFVKLGDPRTPSPFVLKEAEFLFGKSKQFKKDGIWKGKNEKYFILPAIKVEHGNQYYKGVRNIKEKQIPMELWLKIFGFWLAEGSVSEAKNGEYSVYFSSQNKKLLSEIKKILTTLGYNVYQDSKKLRVRDYQLFHYLKQFGKSHERFVPPEIKSLSKELLEILLKYYLQGEGSTYGRNAKGLMVSTSSIRLRDDIQEIALKIGMSAYYKLDRKKGTPLRSLVYHSKIYKQKHDTWKVFFIRKNNPIIYPWMIKKYGHIERWINFNGKVYSLAVPNHVIYVRRNGIPVWCGNSDPPMSWRNSKLDRITLISCSDAHSPSHIGREANVFNCELSYFEIIKAIKEKDKNKFLYTIEFYPEEGKYHYDGHRNCGVSFSPKETKKYNGICPVCGRPLTIGVLNRVEQLADRPEGFVPENAIPFKSLIPLEEIIADALGQGVGTVEVEKEYKNLIEKFENEFNVLMNVARSDLEAVTLPEIAEGIIRAREGKVFIEPGYDGVYGKIRIFQKGEQKNVSKQGTLF
jgi:intein/homing endonuclease